MGLGGRLHAWFGRRDPTPLEPIPSPPIARPTPDPEPDLFQLAQSLEDGALCPQTLIEALAELMRLRRVRAQVEDGPTSPRLTGLRLCREGLPDWWAAGENLLLLGEGATQPDLRVNPYLGAPRRSVVAVGHASGFGHINMGLEGSLVVLGDGIAAAAGALNCYGRSSVLIGEGTTCTNWAMVDCRNGGIILTGADGMWAHGVSLMTDDSHAIRDATTGLRLNTFGGRIVVDRHVWLCEQARLLDGARVGADAVVGAGALVKGGLVPPNTVAVGVPARPVRSGVTWSREDEP